MRSLILFLLLAVAAICPPVRAAVPAEAAAYDTTKARKLYQEGDFEQAIKIVEGGLKQVKALSHSDSVFIFKHLGVMYAASEATRERGKYYMLQLLTIEPTARIMDMYASDMIYMIFRNIQEEFATTQAKLARAQGHVDGNQADPAAEAGSKQPGRTRRRRPRARATTRPHRQGRTQAPQAGTLVHGGCHSLGGGGRRGRVPGQPGRTRQGRESGSPIIP
jgi:hypothetical protein